MKRQIKRREEDEIVMHTFDAKSSTSPFTAFTPFTKSNLRDRVLGEVEKDSFIALPSKGGDSGVMPSTASVPAWER